MAENDFLFARFKLTFLLRLIFYLIQSNRAHCTNNDKYALLIVKCILVYLLVHVIDKSTQFQRLHRKNVNFFNVIFFISARAL